MPHCTDYWPQEELWGGIESLPSAFVQRDANGDVSIHLAQSQQFLPQFETTSVIHPKNLYRRASAGS
jgi:hypothetical protein